MDQLRNLSHTQEQEVEEKGCQLASTRSCLHPIYNPPSPTQHVPFISSSLSLSLFLSLSMSDEDWVKAALTDDSLVGKLLVRLHHAPPPKRDSHLAPPLEWTVRQRRSKPVMILTNKKPTPRASPTTPLSWSGGATSVDGSEESSLPPPSAARSQVCFLFRSSPSQHRRPPALSLLSSFADDCEFTRVWCHSCLFLNFPTYPPIKYVIYCDASKRSQMK